MQRVVEIIAVGILSELMPPRKNGVKIIGLCIDSLVLNGEKVIKTEFMSRDESGNTA